MKNGPYELVKAPESYPGKRYRDKYVYKHHLVWWKHTGKLVPEGYVLHHKNEKRRDNRFRNLELKEWGSHSSLHARKRTMVALVCSWCREAFEREARNVRSKIKAGQTRFYCCRSHQVQHQQQTRHSSVAQSG